MKDECGVFGIFNPQVDVAQYTYWGLFSLQHRGQQSAGICTADGKKMRSKKGKGLVLKVFGKGFDDLQGHLALGHVLYSNAGLDQEINIQPLRVFYDDGDLALACNGTINNAGALRHDLQKRGVIFNTTVDSEVVLQLIACSKKPTFEERVADALMQLKGAFALVLMTDKKLIAVRDRYGFRPLCLGKMEGGWCVASESCSFDLVGAELVRDIKPGEMLVIDNGEKEPVSKMWCSQMPDNCAHCVFEYVYIARNDSRIDKQDVYAARVNLGRQLAKETKGKFKADVVISVPDSGTPAAQGFAMESGLPFMEGLTKNRYVGRTFIQPTQVQRLNSVRLKLNPVRCVVKGKSLVVVDDSIVRGTTSAKLIKLLKGAGAKEVHMVITSPPVVDCCYYGVDTRDKATLISTRCSKDEICKEIGADTLNYISLEGMKEACTAVVPNDLCCACFNSQYPDGSDKVAAKDPVPVWLED
ncbi:MAG: amidophosphoribosyltransferase [Phascolarctobacterium sp.]|nr:amidophosphoribosyltransferase [Candidatus Phascolarctobacterium caballi]